jgi:hypothetical protein
MDDTLDRFLASVTPDERRLLDYSLESLDVVERVILLKYPSTAAMLARDQAASANEIACYIGETFRKSAGGKWTIRLDDPKFVFYGLPILVGGKGFKTPECPLTLATATADRRRGNYLRTNLTNCLKR